MSGGRACKCAERFESLDAAERSNRPGRLWRVTSYLHNNSTFHGGYQDSDYSGIACLRCGSRWRTKAPYAGRLKGFDVETEINITPGCAGYVEQMEAWGRTPYTRD